DEGAVERVDLPGAQIDEGHVVAGARRSGLAGHAVTELAEKGAQALALGPVRSEKEDVVLGVHVCHTPRGSRWAAGGGAGPGAGGAGGGRAPAAPERGQGPSPGVRASPV